MANVIEAADQVRQTIGQWMDANDLDSTLEDLHEFPRAVQETFSHLAEQLREHTNLKEGISEAVMEAANGMAGIADSLREAIGFGVQRS